MLAIPPILIITLLLFELKAYSLKIGVIGAPCPPADISSDLKSETVFMPVEFASNSALPICNEKGSGKFGECFIVCPCDPMASIS